MPRKSTSRSQSQMELIKSSTSHSRSLSESSKNRAGRPRSLTVSSNLSTNSLREISPRNTPENSPCRTVENGSGITLEISPSETPEHSPCRTPENSPGISRAPECSLKKDPDTCSTWSIRTGWSSDSNESVSGEPEGDESELSFSTIHHGKNARVKDRGRTAQRKKISYRGGSKEAVVMTHRTLKDSELLEVTIGEPHKSKSKGVKAMLAGRGSIRIGVTVHNPSHLWPNFPNSMKKMNSGTWMMKGDEVIENGEVVATLQRHNLKNLEVGHKLGLMRTPEFDGSLVIFINGKSIGIVATDIPEEVFGFVELHGDCDNVIMTPDHRVEEDLLPTEIKCLRAVTRERDERESELNDLKQLLENKDAEIKTLKSTIEILSRPPPPPKTKAKKSKETQTTKQGNSPMEDDEPDRPEGETTPSPKPQTSSGKTKTTCCTIL